MWVLDEGRDPIPGGWLSLSIFAETLHNPLSVVIPLRNYIESGHVKWQEAKVNCRDETLQAAWSIQKGPMKSSISQGYPFPTVRLHVIMILCAHFCASPHSFGLLCVYMSYTKLTKCSCVLSQPRFFHNLLSVLISEDNANKFFVSFLDCFHN